MMILTGNANPTYIKSKPMKVLRQQEMEKQDLIPESKAPPREFNFETDLSVTVKSALETVKNAKQLLKNKNGKTEKD